MRAALEKGELRSEEELVERFFLTRLEEAVNLNAILEYDVIFVDDDDGGGGGSGLDLALFQG